MKFTESATLHSARGSHALKLRTARGLWSRFRGLMLTAPLPAAPVPHALFIPRCPSVHGFFMRHAIDVVYLAADGDSRYRVTHVTTLKPWRVSVGKARRLVTQDGMRTWRSAHALELPAGSILKLGLTPDDRLELHP